MDKAFEELKRIGTILDRIEQEYAEIRKQLADNERRYKEWQEYRKAHTWKSMDEEFEAYKQFMGVEEI